MPGGVVVMMIDGLHARTFLWVAVGATIALALDSTIASILNPILAPLKLDYTA